MQPKTAKRNEIKSARCRVCGRRVSHPNSKNPEKCQGHDWKDSKYSIMNVSLCPDGVVVPGSEEPA
jgi:hypothetical protein